MFRNNLHKGLTAMVFMVALALAGARPAAAQGLAWREAWDWVSSFWSNFSFTSVTEAALGDCGPESEPNGCPKIQEEVDPAPDPNGDCGLEIDPNGKCKPAGAANPIG